MYSQYIEGPYKWDMHIKSAENQYTKWVGFFSFLLSISTLDLLLYIEWKNSSAIITSSMVNIYMVYKSVHKE